MATHPVGALNTGQQGRATSATGRGKPLACTQPLDGPAYARDLHMPAPLSSSPGLQSLLTQLMPARSSLQPGSQFL